mmetsp:Transcript_18480/g.22188  ORF Transcript_18480/g.22188 Transcript_18480/m.22188 type:complete len:351 (+) Transcript_18480:79-1131(+)
MKAALSISTLLSLCLVWKTASALSTPNVPNKNRIAERVRSVNYFISRECNYKCKFCFHTAKNNKKLSLGKAQLGLQLLKHSGTEKINFAGGEPFMNPKLLGELAKYASYDLGMAVSIISNGSLIHPKWMQEYGEFVDVLGVSVDSFDPQTNAAIGRGGDANNKHIDRMLQVRELCSQHDILFKMNTVVCQKNWEEDMNAQVAQLDPYRWKAFQVLILEGENSGQNGDLRNAHDLKVSRSQFDAFCQRHSNQPALIPEPNDVMQNSYLLLDEELRFLDCSQGGKVPSESILSVGVEKALSQAGFDDEMFKKRGGIYEWSRVKHNIDERVALQEEHGSSVADQKNVTLAYSQ